MAMRSAERLESSAAPRRDWHASREMTRRRDLAVSIRASLAWRAGRFSETLALLERRHPHVWSPPEMHFVDNESMQPEYPLLNQAYERWLHAEVLRQLGRNTEAIDWYAALGFYSGEELAYLPASRLRMGDIYRQLGDTAAAVEQYRRVVRLWSEGDPELRPLLNEVRGKLGALERPVRR